MTKNELVEKIAKDALVERLVSNVCHRRHSVLPDLVQMVYEALLKCEEGRLLQIYRRGALNFFIVRIIENLYFSRTSPYHKQIRRFQTMSTEYKE